LFGTGELFKSLHLLVQHLTLFRQLQVQQIPVIWQCRQGKITKEL